MSRSFQSIDPADATSQQIYDLMSGTVVPRPIAFVSTLSPDGVSNLAPFSYFMIGGSNPPSLAFSVSGLPEGMKKNTLANIESSREFVVNLVTREVAEAMNQTSASYPSHVSEFMISGLEGLPSAKITPLRVAASPVHFECRLFDLIIHGGGLGSANYVIGEIVQFHVSAELFDGERLAFEKFWPISRMGGSNYLDSSTAEIFSLERPILEQPQ